MRKKKQRPLDVWCVEMLSQVTCPGSTSHWWVWFNVVTADVANAVQHLHSHPFTHRPEGIEGAAVSPSVARMQRSASLSEATHSSCFGFIPVLPAVQKQAVISANKRDKAVLMFPPSPSSTCYSAGTSSCFATKARRFSSYPFESERLQWCRVFIRLLKRKIAIIRIKAIDKSIVLFLFVIFRRLFHILTFLSAFHIICLFNWIKECNQ